MKTIRILGCATVCIALLGLAGAASASASYLKASSYPASISGGGVTEMNIGIQGGSASCQAPNLSAAISSEASTLNANLSGLPCNYKLGTPTLQTNGCQFMFHFGSDSGHFGRFAGTFDIGGAGCGGLTLSSSGCELVIPAQTGLDAAYENIPASKPGTVAKVRVIAEADDLAYTESKGPLCGGGSFNNGTLTGTWELIGAGGVDLSVVEAPHTPWFEAEQIPADELGEQDSTNKQVFSFQGASVSCSSISYSGTLESSTSSTNKVTPSFSGCTAFGFTGASVSLNGCYLRFHAGEALGGGKYKGSEGVICDTGKGIEITAGFCNVKILGQEGSTENGGTLEYENVVRSSRLAIRATANVTGLKYTATSGPLCPLTAGSFSNGKHTGSLILQGKTASGVLQGLRIGG